MGTIELTTRVLAPVERVFEVLAAPGRFAEWWVNPPTGFETYEEDGSPKFRLLARERGRTYPVVGRITAMERPTRFHWVVELPPPGLRSLEERWTLGPDEGRTIVGFRVAYTVAAPGWLAGPIDRLLVRGLLQRRFQREQQNLKRVAEQG